MPARTVGAGSTRGGLLASGSSVVSAASGSPLGALEGGSPSACRLVVPSPAARAQKSVCKDTDSNSFLTMRSKSAGANQV